MARSQRISLSSSRVSGRSSPAIRAISRSDGRRNGIPLAVIRAGKSRLCYRVSFHPKNMFPLPFGDARYAPIAAEDQGRVIAAILNDSAEHAGKIYPLYGPKQLTQYEVADLLTQVLGRRITYVPVEIDAFREVWNEMGHSPYIQQHISAVAQDCRDGVFSGTNDLVEKLTGQKPMPMLDYIVKNKAHFVSQQKKHQTIQNPDDW
jgi:NAD(P)H dehydrogenase (quinone)